MYGILMFAGLVCLLTGLVLRFMVRKHRTESSPPIPSFNPVHWFQPWKMHEWLTPKGLKLHYISLGFLMLGLVLYMMAEGITPLVGR